MHSEILHSVEVQSALSACTQGYCILLRCNPRSIAFKSSFNYQGATFCPRASYFPCVDVIKDGESKTTATETHAE